MYMYTPHRYTYAQVHTYSVITHTYLPHMCVLRYMYVHTALRGLTVLQWVGCMYPCLSMMVCQSICRCDLGYVTAMCI
jgi:hypothetical protein